MTYRVLQNWPNQVLRGFCSWLPLSVLLRQPPLGSFPCLLGWVDTPVIDFHGPCTYPVAFYGVFVTVSWQSRVSMSATYSLLLILLCHHLYCPVTQDSIWRQSFLRQEAQPKSILLGFLNISLDCLQPVLWKGRPGASKWSLCSFFRSSLKGFSRLGYEDGECRGCIDKGEPGS